MAGRRTGDLAGHSEERRRRWSQDREESSPNRVPLNTVVCRQASAEGGFRHRWEDLPFEAPPADSACPSRWSAYSDYNEYTPTPSRVHPGTS